MREIGPHVVHEGSGAGALAMTPAYLVVNGSGDIAFSDIGPPERWFVRNGSDDVEVSASPSGALSILKVNGDYYIL